MIQPLKTAKTIWVVEWIDFDEPCRIGSQFGLPTALFVFTGDTEAKCIGQDLIAELDQRRLERLLGRLFTDLGAPDRLYIAGADEWDTHACEAIARESNFEISFYEEEEQKLPPHVLQARNARNQLAEEMKSKFSADFAMIDNRILPDIAEALSTGSTGIRSLRKKMSVLEKALDLDKNCRPALAALGELEFQRGETGKSIKYHNRAIKAEGRPRYSPGDSNWWKDATTRPYLRSLFGRAICHWHLGNFGEATRDIENLLELNPIDQQGARFLLPLLYQLSDQHDEAARYFTEYAKRYPKDFPDPALLFSWGFCLAQQEEEVLAAEKYRIAILRNIYIAPILLDLPEPSEELWQPHDRAEPAYADEFCYSFNVLWERDAAARRFLGEVYEKCAADLAKLIDLRRKMGELQDQRYEPLHDQLWQELVDEEKALLKSPA